MTDQNNRMRTLLSADRPVPPSRVANVMTFAWRALLKIKHMPEQVFDVVVTPVMFTVLFTYLFGGALAGSAGAYLQFLLPGILVQTVMFTSIYLGFTLNTDLSKGIYDRFKSMPIWRLSPIAGAMTGDIARYSISAAIVFVIGFGLGYRTEAGITGIVASIVLLNVFALGFSWIFTLISLVVRTPSTVMTLGWLVLMPMTFVSNVYVDPATMPGWLQSLVAVNPVSHVTTAIRGLMAGAADIGEIGLALASPLAVAAVCAPIAVRLYNRER
ncbi:ABC transporter permease [Fodinicurvata sp. EGI_FJ10296]|uniref:ABC transporter permease n=1 Tax=Fodinicurvata sp. EGI_FJ10296 TaxID=3231908 RepID=UPI003454C163